MESDPKEILGALMVMTQNQQKAIAGLLTTLQNELVKLEVTTEVASTAASQFERSVAMADDTLAKLGQDVANAAAWAVEPAVVKSFQGASGTAAKALGDATQPLLVKLSDATQRASVAADRAELKMRQAAQWVTWKVAALVAGGVVVIWMLAWYGVWSARQETESLRADIEGMRATVAELEKKGGRFTLKDCAGRVCIEVDPDQGTGVRLSLPWGDAKKGFFVIPKWR